MKTQNCEQHQFDCGLIEAQARHAKGQPVFSADGWLHGDDEFPSDFAAPPACWNCKIEARDEQ